MVRKMTAARKHTPAFKCEAVQVMQTRVAAGVPLQRVSEELEVSGHLLRLWAKAIAGAPPGTPPEEIFPGRGHPRAFRDAVATPLPEAAEAAEAPETELRRLRRENERLRMERDFLKKAAAFFAKESR
jgi:transposase